MLHHLLDALTTTGLMAWQIAWSLVLGFFLASLVEAFIKKDTIADLLPDSRPTTVLKASGLGMASSSCSYAAAALARTLFRKGADFGAAMAFQIASTNLVLELGIILALLIGWQFTVAEFAGGVVMIVVVVLAIRLVVKPKMIDAARKQAEEGRAGAMEGHAAMDMSLDGDSSKLRQLFSGQGFTAVSHIFVMEWAAILRDLIIGLLIAGAAAAWIPDSFWQTIFVSDSPLLSKIIGPLLGPLVAMATFVCSVGNVTLAAVLWNGGISFGGVVSFLFADLLIVPILIIYRKYYGGAMTLRLIGIFYLASVLAGYAVELIFGVIGLIPTGPRNAVVGDESISWDYTTILNIIFLALAAALVVRFFTSGGRSMLAMMGGSPDAEDHAGHHQGQHDH